MAPLAAAPSASFYLFCPFHSRKSLAFSKRQITYWRRSSSVSLLTRAGNSFSFSSSDADAESYKKSSPVPPGETYVGLFIDMLKLDKDHLEREQAVLTLWKYSQGGKHCIDEIMKFKECIILIISLLRSDSDITREAAAGLLRNISSISFYMENVVASGGIEEIVGLLHRSDSELSPEIKEHNLGTLWNLSTDERYRMKIAATEIMSILVKCFDDEELKVKEAAGGVLSNLALSSSNHTSIVESGIISKLAEILINNTDGHRILRKEAKNVLLELSKDEFYKILIIEEGLVFVPLVGSAAYKSFRPVSHSWPSLPDGTEIEKTAKFSRYGASELLLGLNYREKTLDLEEMKMHAMVGRSQQQFLARIGAIEAEDSKSGFGVLLSDLKTVLPWVDGVARLVLILELEDISAVKRAALAIADSSINEHMRFAFKEAGAVRILVQLLYHDNSEIKEAAICALEKLSVSSRVSQILEAEVVLDPLVNILRSGCSSDDVKEKILTIFYRIMDPEKGMKAKFSADLVNGQKKMREDISSSEMDSHRDGHDPVSISGVLVREKIISSDFVSSIVELLKVRSPNMQKMAASVLEYIASSEEHVSIMSAAGIESGLVEFFRMSLLSGEENLDDQPEVTAIKAEETGLSVAAASRLLTQLLNYELFHRKINYKDFITLLRRILKSEIPLSAKDWVAACLLKIESLVDLETEVRYPLDIEVTIYETIPRLVEQMKESASEDVREAAAVELSGILSKEMPEFSRAVVNAGGTHLLVELIDQGSERAVKACLDILSHICMDDEYHQVVVSAGVVSVLRKVILAERPQWNQAIHLLRILPTAASDLL